MNLEQFLKIVEKSKRNFCNLWIEEGPLRAYIRFVSRHYVDGKIRECFDLSSVEVEEEHQQQGHFTRFLKRVESLGYPVRIENVLNSDLERFLQQQNYKRINDHSMIPSYWKEV